MWDCVHHSQSRIIKDHKIICKKHISCSKRPQRVFLNSQKSAGPKPDPCGTPAVLKCAWHRSCTFPTYFTGFGLHLWHLTTTFLMTSRQSAILFSDQQCLSLLQTAGLRFWCLPTIRLQVIFCLLPWEGVSFVFTCRSSGFFCQLFFPLMFFWMFMESFLLLLLFF